MKQHNRHNRPARQRGVTLVELLVAMLIGLIIMAGVVQVFQGNIIASRYQDAMAVVQENARFAMEQIATDLRQAGYLGCGGAREFTVRKRMDEPSPDLEAILQEGIGIEAWEYAGTGGFGLAGTAPAGFPFYAGGGAVNTNANGNWRHAGNTTPNFNVQALPGTDMIRLWGGFGAVADVTDISDRNFSTAELTVDDVTGFAANAMVVINDCQTIDVVQACTVAGNVIGLAGACVPGNLSDNFVNGSHAETNDNIVRLTALDGRLYYVGVGASGEPALFRAGLTNTLTLAPPQELVEGIENLQFLYGLHTDGGNFSTLGSYTPDVYVPASAVPADANKDVVAVRIFMLARSAEDNLLPPANLSYRFMGEDYANPPDARIRQVFTRTVTVRNHAL